MVITLCAFVLASILGFGKSSRTSLYIPGFSVFLKRKLIYMCLVVRQMLIHENKRMEREELELTERQRERIEAAAKLEGVSFEEAVRRRRGFRYLY